MSTCATIRSPCHELCCCASATRRSAPPPDWLAARDEVTRKLDDFRSVNLIVARGVKWRELIDDVTGRPSKSFPLIHMNAGEAVSRRSLVETIISAIGTPLTLRRPSEDLAALSRAIGDRAFTTLGLLNFDFVQGRRGYDKDLHGALRYLVRDAKPRKLQLLVQSHTPFAELLPGREFSSEDLLEPVVLRDRS